MIYKIFSVNPDSRVMMDMTSGITLVAHDANVEGLLFRIPNEFSAIDLTDSGTEPIVRYVLPSDPTKVYVQPTEAYSAAGLTDTAYKYYAWDFGNSVLEKAGIISFSFCVQNATTNQDWNTLVAQLQIADTLDHTDNKNNIENDVNQIKSNLSNKVGWVKVTGSTLYLYADKAMTSLIQTVTLPSGGSGGGSADRKSVGTTNKRINP